MLDILCDTGSAGKIIGCSLARACDKTDQSIVTGMVQAVMLLLFEWTLLEIYDAKVEYDLPTAMYILREKNGWGAFAFCLFHTTPILGISHTIHANLPHFKMDLWLLNNIIGDKVFFL